MTTNHNYIKPEIKVVELVYDPLMLTISGEIGRTGVGNGTADDNDPELARRRDTWDNIW